MEQWGRTLSTHPALSYQDKIDVITLLLRGCDVTRKPYGIPHQVGYYRALCGFFSDDVSGMRESGGSGDSCSPSLRVSLTEVGDRLPGSCWDTLSGGVMREHLLMSEEQFAAALGQKCRDILTGIKRDYQFKSMDGGTATV